MQDDMRGVHAGTYYYLYKYIQGTQAPHILSSGQVWLQRENGDERCLTAVNAGAGRAVNL